MKLCFMFFLLLLSLSSLAQQKITVNGTVISDKDLPLPDVSVKVEGESTGTITDNNGSFTLHVNKGATLLFSNIGYEEKRVRADKDGLKLIVQLTSKTSTLDPVVVVGYGTQKKSTLTAAVSTLNTDEIKNAPVADISNTIAGRIPGIIAAQNSGEPGRDGAEIHIRGIATIGNNAPLVIIDGVPGSFNQLDPNTIATFTVLKDAEAVAPYGMAGANGVILITTKKGKIGAPKLSYSGYYAFQNPTIIAKRLNSYEFSVAKDSADANAGNPLTFSTADIEGYKKTVEGSSDADRDKYPNTDPYSFLQKNAPLTGHTLSISGGADKIKYYMALGYNYQQGILSSDKNNKFNVVANIEAKPTNTTTVNLSINGWNQLQHFPFSSSSNSNGVFSNLINYLPYYPLKFSNGFLGASPSGTVLESYLSDGYLHVDQTKIMSQVSIQQDLPFVKGLNIKELFSYVPTTEFLKNWSVPQPTYYRINTNTNPYSYTPIESSGQPALSESYQMWKEFTNQLILNYHRAIGKSDISGLAVMEVRTTNYNQFSSSRSNYEVNIDEINMGNSNPQDWGTSGSSSETKQIGYVYRVGYSYADKYLFETSGRYDGNYYFAPGHQYGFFPAFSAGWRLSEESFIKNNFAWINNLKIRGSWGESGNLAGGPFQYLSSMGLYGSAYVFNGNVVSGAHETAEPNPNITWERSKKTDVGIDATLWNGLLGLSADYFYEKRSNMLVSPGSVVPAEYGIGIAQENAGIMSNHGIDLQLSSSHDFSKDLHASLVVNFTYAKNKLIKTFESPATYNVPYRRRTGRALNTQFGLKASGLYQSSDFNADGTLKQKEAVPSFGPVAPGDIKYVDMNNDGKIDGNDETVIGSPILPGIIYGFNPTVSYKNFDLSLLFQGAGITDIQLYKDLVLPFEVGSNPTELSVKDAWTPENTDARFPRIYGSGGNNNNQQYQNGWFVWNASYLRLKNLELGYSLPNSLLKTIKLEAVRFYISGQNLLTWTKLPLIDPEATQSGYGDNNARGWYYPQQRVFSFGLNATF